jgi:hypothetical protein
MYSFRSLRLRALASLLLALERRRIACPKAQDYAWFQRGLQQRIAIGEMVFNDQLALQKIWLFSKSGRALALPATDAAVLGTSALYGRQLQAR